MTEQPRNRNSKTVPLSSLERYGVALIITGVAFLAVSAIDRAMSLAPFILFAAAAGAVWVSCGPGPALCSVIVSALLSDYGFLEPRFELSLNGRTLGLTSAYLVGALTSRIAAHWLRARRRES